MYTLRFFTSKLGHAAIASIAAMITFIALSGSPAYLPDNAAVMATVPMVELA